MAVYSEEEPQLASLMAGYGAIKNGNPSRFVSTLLCAERRRRARGLCETMRRSR